jgi:leucyl-tRNA synthetase
MVCKETVCCPEHGFLFPTDVRAGDGARTCSACGKTVVLGRVEKMSKSKKNVIDPNTLLERYGADTTRLFCLFAAPPEKDLEWSEQGVDGGYRFLNRIWRLATDWMDSVQGVSAYDGGLDDLDEALQAVFRKTHQTIRKVTRDIEERFHFNTAISAIMELFNEMALVSRDTPHPEQARVMRLALESLTLLLSPIVPHIAEELWAALGRPESILLARWPEWREEALEQAAVLVVIQVNGKLRSRMTVAVDAADEALKAQALADENVRKFIQGKPVKKVVVVKNKLVNIVI